MSSAQRSHRWRRSLHDHWNSHQQSQTAFTAPLRRAISIAEAVRHKHTQYRSAGVWSGASDLRMLECEQNKYSIFLCLAKLVFYLWGQCACFGAVFFYRRIYLENLLHLSLYLILCATIKSYTSHLHTWFICCKNKINHVLSWMAFTWDRGSLKITVFPLSPHGQHNLYMDIYFHTNSNANDYAITTCMRTNPIWSMSSDYNALTLPC